MIALDTGPDMTGTPRATGQHKRTHPCPHPARHGPCPASPSRFSRKEPDRP
jgi:hypothetical protein